uniref:Uncharacterized protein n=1 Tax=Arundo donax TaxID=35708 RepID=A0A0A8XMS9_ARUDO
MAPSSTVCCPSSPAIARHSAEPPR